MISYKKYLIEICKLLEESNAIKENSKSQINSISTTPNSTSQDTSKPNQDLKKKLMMTTVSSQEEVEEKEIEGEVG